MKNKFILLIALILVGFICVNFASAADIPIKVKTFTFHEVIVTIAENTVEYNPITKVKGETDRNGEVVLTANTDKSEVKVYVQVRRNKETVVLKNFPDVKTSEPLEFTVYPDGYTPPPEINWSNTDSNIVSENTTVENINNNETTNESVVNAVAVETEQTNLTDMETEGNTPITGEAINESSGGFPAFIYYIIIGIVVLIVVFFFMKKGGVSVMKRDPAYDYRTDSFPRSKLSQESLDAEIVSAEKKIKDAQHDIDKIKKEEKRLFSSQRKYSDEELRRFARWRGDK